MIKHSKQRDLIEKVLSGRKDHPTAKVVYDLVREKMDNVSLATVYRNLNMLVENGKLKRVSINNEDHFDPFTHNHSHFVCEKCGKIIDIDDAKDISKLANSVKEIVKGDVTEIELKVRGLCNKCK